MKERLKTLALIANVLLMAALFALSASISIGVSPNMGPLYAASRWLRGESAPIQPVKESIPSAAYPIRLTAVHGQKELSAALTRQEISPHYEQIRSTLEEALSSAQPPQQISSRQYWRLLTEKGAFLLEYDGYPPLYALRAWAGGGESESFDLNFNRLALIAGQEQATLALEDQEGNYWVCDTAAGGRRVQEVLDQWPADGSLFARDAAGCQTLADEEILPDRRVTLPLYDASAPAVVAATVSGGETPRALLECFSMNPYLAKRYTAGDGAAVFVQGSFVLRIYANGRLELSVDEGEGLAGDAAAPPGSRAQAVALIDKTRSVAAAAMNAGGAPMDLSLLSISPLSEQGDYTIVLGYQADGASIVDLEVKASVKKGLIVRMEITVLALEQTGESVLLPARQAAAALDPEIRQARLYPRYRWQEGRLIPYLSYQIEKREP